MKSKYLIILIALFLFGIYMISNSCLTCSPDPSPTPSPSQMKFLNRLKANVNDTEFGKSSQLFNPIMREENQQDKCNDSNYQNCCLDYSNPGFYRCI